MNSLKAEFSLLLADAARSFGIDHEYWDIWGRHHPTPPAALQSILKALGMDASTEESLAEALAAHRRHSA